MSGETGFILERSSKLKVLFGTKTKLSCDMRIHVVDEIYPMTFCAHKADIKPVFVAIAEVSMRRDVMWETSDLIGRGYVLP